MVWVVIGLIGAAVRDEKMVMEIEAENIAKGLDGDDSARKN